MRLSELSREAQDGLRLLGEAVEKRLLADVDRVVVAVAALRAERDDLKRKYDLVQQRFTKLGGDLAQTTQQRDELQRQLSEARKESNWRFTKRDPRIRRREAKR